MQLNTYLTFQGQCEEAFKFYAETLRGSITMLHRFGESPGSEDFPEDMREQVMHVHLQVGDQSLMGSDSPPQMREQIGGFSVSINLDDTAEAERIFAALANGGQVRMPIGETFWAQRFGMCVDRFGVPWMVNACGKPLDA
jgi:PhnB protein